MHSATILECLLPFLIIFKTISLNGEKCIRYNISFFSTTFELINIQTVTLEMQAKTQIGVLYSICYCYPILRIIGICLQILVELFSIKFNQNELSG
jgi:hypothetical protein